MDMQLALRSDIAMALDDCTPYPATETAGARIDGALHALGGAQPRALLPRRVRRAARRPVRHRAGRHAPAAAPGLARGAAAAATGRDLPSAAWPSAKPRRSGCGCSRACVPQMPADRPRYLMGVGRPEDIVAAVVRGIDMFDCVMPTRHARNGHLFTADGRHQHPQQRATRRTSGRSTRPAAATPAATSPRLPAPPRPLQRDPGCAPQHHPQPAFLPGADALAAGGHRRGAL